MTKELAEGITTDLGIMVGKPAIRGTRVPVELVLAKLAANPDLEERFRDYPELTLDQVKACLQYAAKLVQYSDSDRRGETTAEAAAPTSSRGLFSIKALRLGLLPS